MHRLAATPGGWTPEQEGVIFVEQTPAPLVFLTAADTDLHCLAQGMERPGMALPPIRAVNLLQLQQELTIDTYGEAVLRQARVILIRLLGGRQYWAYGIEVVREIVAETGAALVVLPGDDRPDPALISLSTVPLAVADRVGRYLGAGGVENLIHGLMYLCDRTLGSQFQPPPPQPIPPLGRYPDPSGDPHPGPGTVALLFYRAHYLAGNTAPVDALLGALRFRGLRAIAYYVSSLQEPAVQESLITTLQGEGVGVILNTTSFSVAKLVGASPQVDLWQRLNVPVVQVILSGGTAAAWQAHPIGLSPRDIAMNVALPEVDGRIISRAVSFKGSQRRSAALELDVVTYEPQGDRIAFVADLAAHWIHLRQTPPAQRRLALVLANYPNRDGRLANGVGLDTPQSTVEILQALAQAGYGVEAIPAHGDGLIQALTRQYTNDPEGYGPRPVAQWLPLGVYRPWYDTLPAPIRQALEARWGSPEAELAQLQAHLAPAGPPLPGFPIAGLTLGQVFVGIQPSRGYDRDPSLNYHAPDLEPTHSYLAFYLWLRQDFGTQAIVHVGKHGNLEWLPGKGIGLTAQCYPEIALGPLPHFYPFIVNDPGEGSQAKRRAQAVILDHLTPPLTRAELYGPLVTLEGLVDEYYEAQSLDPKRLPTLADRLLTLLQETQLLQDLGLDSPQGIGLGTLLPQLDGYLCDLKEAQIRDGLHIFGRCPQGRQLRDLLLAIARHPSGDRLGLIRAMAQDFGLDVDPLTADLGQGMPGPDPWRTVGDWVAQGEAWAADWVDHCLGHIEELPETTPTPGPLAERELTWIWQTLYPALQATPQEIHHLLRGLAGGYVPSGPAGAPTRNRPDVLPTGRNFYSVDIRAIPTESAWAVGRRAAEQVVERYVQEQGEYPTTLGLSLWGTATMRTGGDDLAEALALLGVQPVWDGPSRRVVDFEILPVATLGRPRVDVTLRVSGFFRDGFAHLIDLFNQVVAAVAALPESPQDNPLAVRVAQETAQAEAQGLDGETAAARSRYRVFGSKPGAYGAGLQGLIEAQNWQDDSDLAQAYLNWSSYAYGANGQATAAPEAFASRLKQMQVVLHNQDNREHDLLDSDDYYQFQGGLTAAVRTLAGQQPVVYFGDNAIPERPKVRSLGEEIHRVYRSRVVNPKWIAGVMRHGYKGAFEMAATVDYLFAYDATAHCVPDHIYAGVAEAYLLAPTVQAFVRQHNPWALRDMAERLLEAQQRGLWQSPPPAMVEQLRAIALSAEGDLENQGGSP